MTQTSMKLYTKVFRNIENSAKGSDSEDDIKGLFDEIVADIEGCAI